MYYRPKIGVAADIIPYYEDGKFYIIYLHDFRDTERYGEGCPWDLLVTKDFINYEEAGTIIRRGAADEQDLYIYTGCVYKKQRTYYVYYTGHNPHLRTRGLPEQKILLAKGDDLRNLKKVKEFVFQAPPTLEVHDFRDPFVFYDEDEGDFKMLIAGREKHGPSKRRGVTLIARSHDLMRWELEETPFYAPGAFYAHECPDYFRIGNWYYLIFSEFSDKFVTRYRYAAGPRGPWLTPVNDIFDTHAFYAAKTVCAGEKRYLLGWNPIKLQEKDYSSWQWGGNIIPHELYQNSDGTLAIKIIKFHELHFSAAIKTEIFKNSRFRIGSRGCESEPDRFSFMIFNKLSESVKISVNVRYNGLAGDFGFVLKCDDDLDRGYLLKYEPKHNRFALDPLHRPDPTLHFMADTEKYMPLAEKEWHEIQIIISGTIAVMYVDGMYAMNLRMFDEQCGRFAIYSNFTDVIFKNITIHTDPARK